MRGPTRSLAYSSCGQLQKEVLAPIQGKAVGLLAALTPDKQMSWELSLDFNLWKARFATGAQPSLSILQALTVHNQCG